MSEPGETLVMRMFSFLHDTEWDAESRLYGFPDGCCFPSTFFTALALERIGFWHASWVFGYRRSTGPHVWCEYEGLIVDLTAGQYADCRTGYVYAKKNLGTPAFTSSFDVVDKGEFDDRFRHTKLHSDLLTIVDRFAVLNDMRGVSREREHAIIRRPLP